MRALRVAVASAVLGASLVGRVLGLATVLVHLDEVQRAVKTAGKVRHVNVECELLVLELEQLVLVVACREVDARANVGTGDELECKRVAGGGDTVGSAVVRTVKSAVRSAGRVVGAQAGVPGVAGVAVGVASGGVEPAPVGIEDDRGLDVRATAGRALLRRELGVHLGGVGANLLAEGHGGEGESDECGRAEHNGW